MAFGPGAEDQLVGSKPSEHSGLATSGGGTGGAGIGAGLGVLTGPAAPVASPILAGIFGALGTALGSLFEPDPEPVYQAAPLPPPDPIPENTFTQELASGALLDPSWTQPSPPLSNVYGVQNPYGFG